MEEKIVLSHIEHQIELFEVEFPVLPPRKRLSDLRHPCVIAQEVAPLYRRRVEAFVAELAQETAVSHVRLQINTSQVRNPVVRRAAVDVIHRHALGDRPTCRHPDGMGDQNIFVLPESVFECQIPLFAHSIAMDFAIRRSRRSRIEL